MATVTKHYLGDANQIGNAPYGNLSSLHFKFETNSSGVLANSTQTTAVLNGDVVNIGILPKGFKPTDCVVYISDAFAGSTTASIGFKYKDGVDDTAVPQDDDFFAAALSTASTGISRKTNVTPPVVLPKDAYLTLTIGGANHSAVGVLDIVVMGESTGGN
jgi:hypothetical protein